MAQPLPPQFHNQLFSLVVRGDQLVLPTLYIPRIMEKTKEGKPVLTKSGYPMVNVNMDYAIKSYNTKVVRFQSVMQDRARLDDDVLKACDTLKKFLNSNPVMLWFHREERGCGCTEGNHLHIMYWNKGKDVALSQQKPYRTLRQKIKAIPGASLQQEKVRTTGIFIYLNSGNAIAKMTQTENSRIFMGTTSFELLKFNADYHPSKLKQAYSHYKKCWVSNEKDEENEDIITSDEISNEMYGVFGMKPPVLNLVTRDDGTVVQEGKAHSNIAGLIDPKIPNPVEINAALKRKRMDEMGNVEFDEDDELLSVALCGPKNKKSKTDTRVEGMVRLYQQYKNQNFKKLMAAVVMSKDPADMTIVREVNRSSNRVKILEAAMMEFSLFYAGNQNPEPVMSLYSTSGYMVNKYKSMTVFQTLNLLNTWCDEMGESMFGFLTHCYLILACKLKKMNCLLLEGVSNAGKTYWIECMLKPIEDHVGRVLSNEEKFRYGYLEGMSVARCEEFGLLTRATADDFKQIAGGQTFQANVKHKSPVMVDRLPMIVTTNHTLWKLIPHERQAILNRCIRYQLNKSANCLKESKLEPNSDLFKYCFEYFEEEGLTCNEEDGQLNVSFKNPGLNEKNVMSMFAAWIFEKLLLEDEENEHESEFHKEWMQKEDQQYEFLKDTLF